jgi:predicted RNA binding protein YcfA (HicA-like mRNA interferase family)
MSMANLPQLSGKQVIRALNNAGFTVVRTSGSHHVMRKEGNRNHVTVPVHGNKPIKVGTLRAIIKSAGMTVDEFLGYL